MCIVHGHRMGAIHFEGPRKPENDFADLCDFWYTGSLLVYGWIVGHIYKYR